MEEEGSYEKNLRPEDMVDEDARYESDEENVEAKPKEKPVGPPLEIELPLHPPPADPTKVYSCFFYLLLQYFLVIVSSDLLGAWMLHRLKLMFSQLQIN